jgi:hypothetical protein
VAGWEASTVSELLSVIDAAIATDVHGIPEPSLLVHTETLIEARDRIDAALAVALQAMDARQVAVNEGGRTTRSWLVEDQRLGPKDAAQRMWVARPLPFHPRIQAAFLAGVINHEHVRVIINGLRRLLPDWRATGHHRSARARPSRRPGPTRATV